MHAAKPPGIIVQLVQTSGCYANPLQSRRSCYGKDLRLDMMTHQDSFPISHNFYSLRYFMVSFRAHPSTQKNCITEDSCILQYLRSLRSERADVARSTDCGTVHTLMRRYFYPGEYKVKSYFVQIFRTLRYLQHSIVSSTISFL